MSKIKLDAGLIGGKSIAALERLHTDSPIRAYIPCFNMQHLRWILHYLEIFFSDIYEVKVEAVRRKATQEWFDYVESGKNIPKRHLGIVLRKRRKDEETI